MAASPFGEGLSSTRGRVNSSPFSTLQPQAIAEHRIHPKTRPAFIHLRVASLARLIPFYQTVLGLQIRHQTKSKVVLGTSERALVILEQFPQGKRYRGVCGLYHFALLLPDRRELARVVARLFALRYPNYPTDHIMTKTTYLDDPEGNTIEIYCESPEDGVFSLQDGNFFARRADGSLSDGREPLDLEALFAHLTENDRLDQPLPPQTGIGHFHLHVASLEQTRTFYHELLGFDDMGIARRFRMGMVSAGGYHHHIGYNTWQGEGAPPPPADALGLTAIAFSLPHVEAWNDLRRHVTESKLPVQQEGQTLSLVDPCGIPVLFFPLTENPISSAVG
ncbi:MAG: VOC family protein [Anaerolineales bacterium]